MVTLTTLTQATAQQRLGGGLTRLGLAMPLLGPSWGPGTPTFDAAQLTLGYGAGLRAPWRGTLEPAAGELFRDVSGAPVATGTIAAFRFHPQAARRLAALARARYAPGGAAQPRPMPVVMVVRDVTLAGVPIRFEPGDALVADPNGAATQLGGTVSFHDARGLIVCPLAVAAMFTDLVKANPPLASAGALTLPQQAGVDAVAVHAVDPHGRAWTAPGTATASFSGGGAITTPVSAWPAGQTITPGTGARVGLMADGRLGDGALALPTLPSGVTLARQFFRVCVVDVAWHLLGNRTGGVVAGIAGDDQAMPADLLPRAFQNTPVRLLADAPATLAAAATVAQRSADPNVKMFLLVSPLIEKGIGATGLMPWLPPQAPAPAAVTGLRTIVSGITARWTGATDVVVSVPTADTTGAVLPAGGHLRLYPRRFQVVAAIGNTPSFVRGDGAAAPIPAALPTTIDVLLPDPLGLGTGTSQPDDPVLAVDLIVADRAGGHTNASVHAVKITTGGSAPADPWAPAMPDAPDGWADMMLSPCASPIFGTPTTPPSTPSTGVGLPAIVGKLASEGSPRQGPRLPTMARFETIVATAVQPASATKPLWEAVLTGGWWARQTRSAFHALGNPGNPAGPDLHAPGVWASGPVAHAIGRHALRRTQPMLPLPGFIDQSGNKQPGWLMTNYTTQLTPPDDLTAQPAGSPSFSAALLTTVAAFTETPELSLKQPLPTGPIDLQKIADDLTKDVALKVTVNPGPTYPQTEREVRREWFTSAKGCRDAAWSLRRAIAHATELVYLEGPAFQRTAYRTEPTGTPDPPEMPDLVADLATALAASRALRVIIAVSREADFATSRGSLARQAIASRTGALDDLAAQFPGRVALFHPMGAPGRPAQLRTSITIVDDVYALVGTSHFRRRGLSFDGGVDLACIDDDFRDGVSVGIRAFRQALMAAKLGVMPPTAPAPRSPDWNRLAQPRAAFEFVAALLAEGGLGRIESVWRGPETMAGGPDTSILTATADQADPNGAQGATATIALAGILDALG